MQALKNPEVAMDQILNRMEVALSEVDHATRSRKSIVKLVPAEVELLLQLEAARDMMMFILGSEKDRKVLQNVFGGDCVRIARLRAVLDAVAFSPMNSRDQRKADCLSACESVQQVLGDLGLGFALRLALAQEKVLLQEKRHVAKEQDQSKVKKPSLLRVDGDASPGSSCATSAAPTSPVEAAAARPRLSERRPMGQQLSHPESPPSQSSPSSPPPSAACATSILPVQVCPSEQASPSKERSGKEEDEAGSKMEQGGSNGRKDSLSVRQRIEHWTTLKGTPGSSHASPQRRHSAGPAIHTAENDLDAADAPALPTLNSGMNEATSLGEEGTPDEAELPVDCAVAESKSCDSARDSNLRHEEKQHCDTDAPGRHVELHAEEEGQHSRAELGEETQHTEKEEAAAAAAVEEEGEEEDEKEEKKEEKEEKEEAEKVTRQVGEEANEEKEEAEPGSPMAESPLEKSEADLDSLLAASPQHEPGSEDRDVALTFVTPSAQFSGQDEQGRVDTENDAENVIAVTQVPAEGTLPSGTAAHAAKGVGQGETLEAPEEGIDGRNAAARDGPEESVFAAPEPEEAHLPEPASASAKVDEVLPLLEPASGPADVEEVGEGEEVKPEERWCPPPLKEMCGSSDASVTQPMEALTSPSQGTDAGVGLCTPRHPRISPRKWSPRTPPAKVETCPGFNSDDDEEHRGGQTCQDVDLDELVAAMKVVEAQEAEATRSIPWPMTPASASPRSLAHSHSNSNSLSNFNSNPNSRPGSPASNINSNNNKNNNTTRSPPNSPANLNMGISSPRTSLTSSSAAGSPTKFRTRKPPPPSAGIARQMRSAISPTSVVPPPSSPSFEPSSPSSVAAATPSPDRLSVDGSSKPPTEGKVLQRLSLQNEFHAKHSPPGKTSTLASSPVAALASDAIRAGNSDRKAPQTPPLQKQQESQPQKAVEQHQKQQQQKTQQKTVTPVLVSGSKTKNHDSYDLSVKSKGKIQAKSVDSPSPSQDQPPSPAKRRSSVLSAKGGVDMGRPSLSSKVRGPLLEKSQTQPQKMQEQQRSRKESSNEAQKGNTHTATRKPEKTEDSNAPSSHTDAVPSAAALANAEEVCEPLKQPELAADTGRPQAQHEKGSGWHTSSSSTSSRSRVNSGDGEGLADPPTINAARASGGDDVPAATDERRSSTASSTSSAAGAFLDLPDPDEDHGQGLEALPELRAKMVQQVFNFYAGTDATSGGTGLGNTRFRTFLRDCGVLRNEAFGPEAMAMAASDSLRPSLSMGSVASVGSSSAALAGRKPRRSLVKRFGAEALDDSWRSTNATMIKTRTAEGSQRRDSGAAKLPLRVFRVPPLSFPQVDIIYRRATRNSSCMGLDGFAWALTDLAIYCGRKKLLDLNNFPGGTPDQALEVLVQELLAPLGEVLGLDTLDATGAKAAMLEPDIQRLMQKCQRGLDLIFRNYASNSNSPEPYQRGHWTVHALKRFANDVQLSSEVSMSSLQRIFNECVIFEVHRVPGAVEGKMSFTALQVALVMLAERVHLTPGTLLMHLAHLMMRLSVAGGSRDLSLAARSVMHQSHNQSNQEVWTDVGNSGSGNSNSNAAHPTASTGSAGSAAGGSRRTSRRISLGEDATTTTTTVMPVTGSRSSRVGGL